MTDPKSDKTDAAPAKGPHPVAAAAAWNAPSHDSDLAASFNAREDALAFAGEYGGDVEAVGVAFVVRGSDAKRARDDAAKLARG